MFSEFKKFHYLVMLVLLAGALLVLSFYYFTMFQMFAAGVFLGAVNIAIFDYVDEKVNYGINTAVEIIERRNIALSVYYLAIAILISSGCLAAALAFFALK